IEDTTEESQLPVDRGRSDLLLALGDVPLHVTWENLRQCSPSEGVFPRPAIAFVVVEPAQLALVAGQVVVDDGAQQPIPTPEALREEPSLLNLGLALLVHLDGQRLRADLLAVAPTVLVEETDPPDTRVLGVLVHTARSCAFRGVVSVVRAWHESRACRAIRKAAHPAPGQWPRRSRPSGQCLAAQPEQQPGDAGQLRLPRPTGSALWPSESV